MSADAAHLQSQKTGRRAHCIDCQKVIWLGPYQALNKARRCADCNEIFKTAKIAAYARAYYERNKAKIAADMRAYRERNKAKIAAYARAYYERNKAKIAAYARANRERNKVELKVARELGIGVKEARQALA